MTKKLDLGLLARTTDEVFSLNELRTRLETGRPLRIKYGVDVTAPFLHIGHAVNLWMMRTFQEHGHKVVFLIGDFTTRIGDPTGRSSGRVAPEREDIEKNAVHFIEQVGKVLLTDPEVFEIRRNSEWFDKMGVDKFMSLLSLVTHSRLIQRDMFQRRIAANHEIHMHELLYPILQGYDSYMLESDLTIVGTDQLFNELMGRFYQEKFDQAPQVVMTTRITPGTDGVEKQSKSLGNYIALADTPRDIFGKTMSIPDQLIIQYLEVYTDHPMEAIRDIEKEISSEGTNPLHAKKLLAEKIIERYYGADVAREERNWFDETFSKRQTPTDIPSVAVPDQIATIDLITRCAPNLSRSEVRRLIRQGAVKLDGQALPPSAEKEPIHNAAGKTLQVGKRRWFKLEPE